MRCLLGNILFRCIPSKNCAWTFVNINAGMRNDRWQQYSVSTGVGQYAIRDWSEKSQAPWSDNELLDWRHDLAALGRRRRLFSPPPQQEELAMWSAESIEKRKLEWCPTASINELEYKTFGGWKLFLVCSCGEHFFSVWLRGGALWGPWKIFLHIHKARDRQRVVLFVVSPHSWR